MDQQKLIKWGGLALLGLFLYRVVSKAGNGILSGLTAANEVSTISQQGQAHEQNEGAVRTSLVKQTCETLEREIDSFNQDESEIFRLVNTLDGEAEVLFASAYYKQITGRSLRAEVQGALPSSIQFLSRCKFSNLKSVIQQKLY